MAIPRQIHLNWLGAKPLTPLAHRCIASMIDRLPYWTIKLWRNDGTWGAKDCPWAKTAIYRNKFCSASNYFRAWKLYHEGGVYLDIDVEVLRPFDVDMAAFIGFQGGGSDDMRVSNAVMGCEPGHWFMKELLDQYEPLSPDYSQLQTGCQIPTMTLKKYGLSGEDTQTVRDIKVYSREYLHPLHWEDRSADHTNASTFCKHHLEGGWAGE